MSHIGFKSCVSYTSYHLRLLRFVVVEGWLELATYVITSTFAMYALLFCSTLQCVTPLLPGLVIARPPVSSYCPSESVGTVCPFYVSLSLMLRGMGFIIILPL